MPTYDRSHSILQMTSPLGTDVLIPTAISGYEAISQPFSYRVQIVSTKSDIAPDSVLHQPGCIILRRDDEPARYFHGIFQEFAATGQARPDAMYSYHAVLVPKFWFLSQTIDCRVYQNKSAVDILQKMLDDAGVTASDFRLYNKPPVREYTVQFNETDLQFATRLMEETGLYYFFEHTGDQHTLVVADNNDAFQAIPNGSLRFNANIRGEDVLTAWHSPRGTIHGKVTLKDYDPIQPGKLLEAHDDGAQDIPGAATRDVFLWPAATFQHHIVSGRSKYMADAAIAANAVVSGAGAFRPLTAGAKFNLEADGDSSSQGGSYAVRWMSFEAVDESWSTDGAPAFYANSFESFDTSTQWRQPFSVPKPDMGGVHAGIVLGPEGEEIYTDQYGRVKVKFFWDHWNEATADLSIWARVVQPWAGNGWGTQFIPRVGTEVAVAFMNGDADHPVVLGGLYNGQQTPIYPLAEKTKSGLRTRSSLQGGTSDFNELTFDDKKGQEMLFTQAQKDMSTKVKHDQTLNVGNDRSVTVDNDETITVGENRAATIKQGNDSLTVQQGDLSIQISQGKATVTAMQSIELTVGSNSIRIDQTGVTINGMLISVNGTASISLDAPMTSVSGDATVTITGGLVEIN
ncbi:MAG TPA: type VI secretion system tip protein TssI/VgrG [Rhodopila sp.]|jgi:type VI secretion system secreted protein VgrG|nr:type VI secretion system tip protein TssI/VgrG [Rhodopila sp.]